ncbi:unnamed protein product, partial [Linum tenue]
MADSGNLNTFSLRILAGAPESVLGLVSGSGGERSSLTRVLRALVRSRNGGTEMELDPL